MVNKLYHLDDEKGVDGFGWNFWGRPTMGLKVIQLERGKPLIWSRLSAEYLTVVDGDIEDTVTFES